jgi:hexosaminidase
MPRLSLFPLLLVFSASLAAEPGIIPRPAKLEESGASLVLNHPVITADPAFRKEAEALESKLRSLNGTETATTPAVGSIVLTSAGAKDLGPEGYTLETSPTAVTIRAATAAGIFYGCQSLLDLVPVAAVGAAKTAGWEIPRVNIEDRPYLAWRGFMLDESRHFFGKQSVKTLLDQLASMKFNVFHWHLTDDNGWRIEIKIGAWRQRDSKGDGPGDANYGGFYTQEDIREVIAYAAERHITVVPEIDMPGHFAAAMVAYPQLAPDNGWVPAIPPIKHGTFGMCVAKPEAVQFCKDVLDEVLALFPSKEIHIGGDEVDFKQWQSCPVSQAALKTQGLKDFADLQIHFQNEMIAYLESKGRHAIVWNNICRPTVDKRSINHFWRPGTMNAARNFASAGYKIFHSDSSVFYYARTPPLQKAYQYDPLTSCFPGELSRAVAGVEACEWSERLPDLKALERLTYPLIFVHSELLWTSPDRKDWNSFTSRLKTAEARCEQAGIDYNRKASEAALQKALDY